MNKNNQNIQLKNVCFLNLIFIGLMVFKNSHLLARTPIPASRFDVLTGINTAKDSKYVWDRKFSRNTYVFGKNPSKFLVENYEYLPDGIEVLDIGMGEGRNAVFLARQGYKVTGVDISSVAIKKAKALAKERGVSIKTFVSSINNYNVKEGTLDAAIMFYYLDRSLIAKIKKWLKPGGILIFEAYTTNQLSFSPKKEKKFLLRPRELLELFNDMILLKFEEPLHENVFRSSGIFMKPKMETLNKNK